MEDDLHELVGSAVTGCFLMLNARAKAQRGAAHLFTRRQNRMESNQYVGELWSMKAISQDKREIRGWEVGRTNEHPMPPFP